MRTVKIEEYWPLIVKNTEEFGQIATAENPEFNRLAECIYNVLKDGFIQDATEYGVSRWENMLGLAVTPDMSLEDRKVAILTYLSVKLPYTWRVLKQMLTGLLGEDNFEMALDNDTQTITIGFGLSTTQSQIASVNALMERVVPKNLIIENEWINGLPFEYTPVEYLQGAGKQWINTEVAGNETSEVRCTFERTTAASPAIYAAAKKGVTDNVIAAFAWGDVMETLRFDWFTAQRTVKNVYPGGMVTTVQTASGVTLDGVQIYQPFPEGAFISPTFVLFSLRAEQTAWTADNIRMARWALKTNGQQVRDMVAALDPTGAPCMYDLVTHTPFYNDSGIGDFLYPTDTAPVMTLDLDEKFYAKRTEHGIRRLYHVPKGCTMSKDEYAAKNGFKEILEPPMPQEGYWVPQWRETETQLICEWVETEPPTEEGIENE